MKRLFALLFTILLAFPAYGQQAPQSFGTVNGSVIIATGNTFQTILAANPRRRSLTIQNNNATDSCWIFIGATASATKGTSILLLPAGAYTRYYPYLPSDNIAGTCASSSDTLYVDTQ